MRRILLDRNENQYGPSPKCYEVLRNANLEELSLYSRDYMRGVKSELSERLSHLLGIPEQRILLSYGSEDLLKQVVHCYLHRGETMLLPRQSWWYYKSLADEKEGRRVEYTLRERNGRFLYDADDIISLYSTHLPSVILIASPNNPTGNSINLADLSRLVAHCTQSVVVLDEAYYGFSNEANDHLKHLVDVNPRLVVLRTFSKYYALAGLRIGYGCVGSDLLHLVSFSTRYLGFNRLSEKIALSALDDPGYYQRIAFKMREDKEHYYRVLSTFEGFTPFVSDANFVLVRYPLNLRAVLSDGLAQHEIVVKFLDDPGLEDCLRITVGTTVQNARVLTSLQEIIPQHVPTRSSPATVRQ
jgi:histidinol-phosphate aminotransferase